MKAVALLVISLACVLGCYKYCNGHGNCGPKDKCECYLGWGGADCSLRSCPYGEALVDIPLGDLNHDGSVNGDVVKTEWRPKYGLSENLNGYVTKSRAHRYAECSNSGSCNRESGDCECYKGYEGSACQRRSCPSSVDGVSCSGNGICMSSTAYAKEQGSSYYGWELDKFYTCKCDAGYEGVDCSLRQCPSGLDPVTYSGATMYYEGSKEVEPAKGPYTLELTYDGMVYPTPEIPAIPEICGKTGGTAPFTKDASIANSYQEVMKRALQAVAPLTQASVKIECSNPSTDNKMKFTINVESSEPSKFLSSKIEAKPTTGGNPDFGFEAKINLNDGNGGITDPTKITSKLCGGRGLCDSKTGLCSCFTGYYGYACENQRTIQL